MRLLLIEALGLLPPGDRKLVMIGVGQTPWLGAAARQWLACCRRVL